MALPPRIICGAYAHGLAKPIARRLEHAMKFSQVNGFSKTLLTGTTIATMFAGMTDAALARYLDPSNVDLVGILAPPPAPQSPEGKAELEAVLAVQRTRIGCGYQTGSGRR
jgi:hypothetical protein